MSESNLNVSYFFIALFLLGTIWARAQTISDLSTTDLQEDFDHLVAGLERYNPAMYAYISKTDFRNKVAKIQASITAPINAIQFFKLLCFAVEEVDEGHVTIGTEQDAFYRGFLKGQFKSLPLSIQLLGGRAYVWNNLSQVDELERGDELVSINGRSIARIQTEIFKYTISDGAIETFKEKRLSNEFSARYFWFVEQPDSFRLVYRKKELPTTKELVVAALTRTEMASWSTKRKLKNNQPKGIDKVYNLTINGNVATLTLRSFNEQIIKENDLTAMAFYERIFKRLRQNNIQHLILDVRDNIGGMKEFGDDLLAFALRKNKKGTFRTLTSWDGKVVASEFPKRNKWFFKGDWYVLTNGGTYSTASLIAQYLQAYAAAKVIGQETGSRYEGFAAGTYHHLTLPNSNVRIGIPNKWVQHANFPKPTIANRGVLPTHFVNITIEDLLEKRDVIKEKAWELIQQK